MVGHICRFNPRYACAKREIEEGRIGDIVSIYARRNLSAGITDEILNKIGPIIGDGVHDTDLMLWYTGQKIKTAYAQTTDIRGRKYPDIGWTMYRFENGATGVCENNWAMNGNLPMWLDERMVVHGTKGSISIKDTAPNYSIVDGDGLTFPDATYWPEYHGMRRGALRDEWHYFTECVVNDTEQNIILAEESMAAVKACLAAEESARSGQIVTVN